MSGALVYLVVDDVDALHEDLLRRHVAVDMPPTDQTWGTCEMYVRDDDRNKIAFVRPAMDAASLAFESGRSGSLWPLARRRP